MEELSQSPQFGFQMLLALGGYAFHLLKQWNESIKRKEVFIVKSFIISICMNLVAIPILIYIGGTLPSDMLVMSPFTCVIIGAFGASMLSGFINSKKPKETVEEDIKTLDPNKNKTD